MDQSEFPYSEAFWKNEEAGERRVNFFITLATAVAAVIAVLLKNKEQVPAEFNLSITLSTMLIAVVVFGLATFLKMLHRDRVTAEYLARVVYLREQLRTRVTGLDDYRLPSIDSRHWFLRGGLATTVSLMNSFLLAVLAVLWIQGGCEWAAAFAVFLLSFVLQAMGIEASERAKEIFKNPTLGKL